MNFAPFIICAIVIGAPVFAVWATVVHLDNMENDPDYRKRARKRGW